MQLPGGIYKNNRRNKNFCLKTPGGEVDLALYEAFEKATNHPQWVSCALLEVLDSLADDTPTLEDVQTLCLADRQAIAIAWQIKKGQTHPWFSKHCEHCNEPFDLQVPVESLPFSKAKESFPFCEVSLHNSSLQNSSLKHKTVTLRAPDGHDLELISKLSSPSIEMEEVRQKLALRLITQQSLKEELNLTHSQFALSDKDIEVIEDAVESLVPELAVDIASECPECGYQNVFTYDPYQSLISNIDHLLDEVHVIAQTYHWHEQDILKMPQARRQQYLRRIERDSGVTGEWS